MGDSVNTKRDIITDTRSDQFGLYVVFRFSDPNMRDKFGKVLTELPESKRRDFILAISSTADQKAMDGKSVQGLVEFPIEGRTVKVNVTARREASGSGKCIYTIQGFDAPLQSQPKPDDTRTEKLLADIAEGKRVPELVRGLGRKPAYALTFGDKAEIRIEKLLRNGKAPNFGGHGIDYPLLDEALAFLAAVEGQGLSIDERILTFSDGTTALVLMAPGVWKINNIQVHPELCHLYRILDALELYGINLDNAALNDASAGGAVKLIDKKFGIFQANLGLGDRILFKAIDDGQIMITDIWGHTPSKKIISQCGCNTFMP